MWISTLGMSCLREEKKKCIALWSGSSSLLQASAEEQETEIRRT